MKKMTLGVFSTHNDAKRAIDELLGSGIKSSDLSYLYLNKKGKIEDAEMGPKMGGGAAVGATTGAVIGAIAGLVVANGILPGLGSLFVAGPLATALGLTGAAATTVAGAATGAVAGGLVGVLTKMGVDKEDASLYEHLVRAGDILVVAHTNSPVAKDIFTKMNAKEIREYSAD